MPDFSPEQMALLNGAGKGMESEGLESEGLYQNMEFVGNDLSHGSPEGPLVVVVESSEHLCLVRSRVIEPWSSLEDIVDL